MRISKQHKTRRKTGGACRGRTYDKRIKSKASKTLEPSTGLFFSRNVHILFTRLSTGISRRLQALKLHIGNRGGWVLEAVKTLLACSIVISLLLLFQYWLHSDYRESSKLEQHYKGRVEELEKVR